MRKIIFLFITTFSFAQSVTKTMNLLADTGQNTSYTATFGEDNDYSINMPSFTNNANGTIIDNVTGLMWQQADGGEMTIESAYTYADNLVLGGFSDWRLPTPRESFSILNHQNTNPALNTTYFTNTNAGYWWTNTYQTGDNTKVWVTNAGGGIGNKPKSETISAGGTSKFHARAVRDITTPAVISNHFTDNGNGTITDNLTQLIWQKTPNATAVTWENAITYAEGLSLASANDWRLPNIKELQSLNDESLSNPSVNQTFFGSIGVKNYWSSTTVQNQTLNAWFWNTEFGITTFGLKTTVNYVICVKGNPVNLAINSVDLKSKIKVFPNPVTSKITIENAVGNEYFKLYNEIGLEIFYGKNIEKKDFSDLLKGIYILEIKGETDSKIKLIKQ
ncbi:DUF1566 domain-containing protein [Flavobacterium sp. GSP14]|uniref:Lcl domain-containing protein n=1 Tax=Flavobacterium sp. GSP14 TaxID=3401734 RepID=UPI003AAC46FA